MFLSVHGVGTAGPWAGDYSVVDRRAHDRKIAGSNPGRTDRRMFVSRNTLSILTLASVSVPPLCYRSCTQTFPVILPKVQVAAMSQVNTHTPLTHQNRSELTRLSWPSVGIQQENGFTRKRSGTLVHSTREVISTESKIRR